MKYDSSIKYKWDNENVMEYAVRKAKQEGEHAKEIAVAREMKNDKMSAAQISKFTGLSTGEIEKL